MREYEDSFKARQAAQDAFTAADEALKQACYAFENCDQALSKHYESIKAGARLRAKGEL